MQNLMQGKRGLIMGVANARSIATGIAKALSEQGAELAFTYQGERLGKNVKALADELGSSITIDCDVTSEKDLPDAFKRLKDEWGKIDFLVHSVAYTDKEQMAARISDITPENFNTTMSVSCGSFIQAARHAKPLMTDGGSMLTLSYFGGEKVIPNYDLMGVAKAALESSVKYLADDLGKDDVRVNCLSAGTMRTLSGAAIPDGRYIMKTSKEQSPLRRSVELEELGKAALYLLSDWSSATTGETHHVDCGYHVMGMGHHTAE